METEQKELRLIRIAGLLLCITSIVLVFIAIYFTPNFVSANLSEDGILYPTTILKIQNIRKITGILGIFNMLLAALFLIKSKLIYSISNISAIRRIRKNCLSIIIGMFFLVCLTQRLEPTIKSIVSWKNEIKNLNEHELRLKYHLWYRRQHVIWETIQSNTPNNEPLLIIANNCPEHFFPYFLAPRPVYTYSKIIAAELSKAGQRYIVLEMTWNGEMEWKIKEVGASLN